ncbi:unnamed protein product [Ectocarpus sp. 8 AP-2014]
MSSIVNGLFGVYPSAEQRPEEYEFRVDYCPGAFGANLFFFQCKQVTLLHASFSILFVLADNRVDDI